MRKIETDCYAIIRATGRAVLVGKKYPGYAGAPALFATSIGGISEEEYQASELKRIDASEFAACEARDELANWDKFLGCVED